MERTEIRLAGAGGQGIILASIILAEGAVAADKYACQSQAYGPEARGGACKAEVVISDSRISYPEVRDPDFVMALTQKAADKYVTNLKEGTVILLDSRLTLPEEASKYRVYQLPILDTAEKVIGRAQTANIIAVGAINSIFHICSNEQLFEAARKRVPQGTEELNLKALLAGEQLIAGE